MTVNAQAGGAQKIYWIIKREAVDTVVAVDQLSYTLDAGRVVGDTSFVLQFKAVYANETKTHNIPVTIKEAIPEPVFTLSSPAAWNGRDTIDVVPAISNLAAMQAAGAGKLSYRWTVSGGRRDQGGCAPTNWSSSGRSAAAGSRSPWRSITAARTLPPRLRSWSRSRRAIPGCSGCPPRTRNRRTTSSSPVTTRTRARSIIMGLSLTPSAADFACFSRSMPTRS